MKILTPIFILSFLNCFSQTWPTKDCPDKPYTKGNDGVIYHTCDCGVKSGYGLTFDSFGTLRSMDTTTWNPMAVTAKKKIKPNNPIDDKSFFARDRIFKNGRIIKENDHYDSLACPFCGRILPKIHIKVRIAAGLLLDKLDKNGQFIMTPLGKRDMVDNHWRDHPEDLPRNLMAYLPKDFWKKKTKYIDDLNDWTK